MPKQKEITVNGKKKIARELTAIQIRQLLDGDNDDGPSIVDLLYPGKIPCEAAAMSVGLSKAALEKMTPSELEPIMEAATEVNPFLAALIERMAKVGAAAIQAKH